MATLHVVERDGKQLITDNVLPTDILCKRDNKPEVLDIVCPGCKGRYHETTEAYKSDIAPNGSMFRLKEPYRTAWRWSSFSEQSHVRQGDLDCPSCGAPYLSGGRVLIAHKVPLPKKKRKYIKKEKAEAL